MGGIAGIITADGSAPDEALMERLGNALVMQRGETLLRQRAEGFCLLAAGRTDAPVQTQMRTVRKGRIACIEANAQVFDNDAQLTALLQDTDTTLAADPEIAARQIPGGFVFACYEADEDRTILQRDPIGRMPLYYCENNQGFFFASTPTALFAAGILSPEIENEANDELLQLQFTTGTDCIFRNVRRLLPGERLEVAYGRTTARHRYDFLPDYVSDTPSLSLALEQLDDLLKKHLHSLQSDAGSTALYYSGGTLSTLLLNLLAPLAQRQPVLAWVGHDEEVLKATEAMAAKMGMAVLPLLMDADKFWTALPHCVARCDDAVGDYAAVPLHALSEEVAKAGIRRAVTGHGGAEIFAGRGRHRAAVRPWYLGGPRIMHIHGRFDRIELLRHPLTAWRDGIRAAESLLRQKSLTPLQYTQQVDCATWLPNDVLLHLDRCGRHNGIDIVTPFLDPAIVEFGLSLPDKFKLQQRQGMHLLQAWLRQAEFAAAKLPRSTWPIAQWLVDAGPALAELVAAQPGIQQIAYPNLVEELFRRLPLRHGLIAWALVHYALWHHCHILGHEAQGDVFSTLSQSL